MKMSLRIGICVFFLALAFGLNITGIMPVLGLIQETYSDQSTGMVQLMQTLPYATLMLDALMIGSLTGKYSKKTLALASVAIIGVCGVMPFFFESFLCSSSPVCSSASATA